MHFIGEDRILNFKLSKLPSAGFELGTFGFADKFLDRITLQLYSPGILQLFKYALEVCIISDFKIILLTLAFAR